MSDKDGKGISCENRGAIVSKLLQDMLAVHRAMALDGYTKATIILVISVGTMTLALNAIIATRYSCTLRSFIWLLGLIALVTTGLVESSMMLYCIKPRFHFIPGKVNLMLPQSYLAALRDDSQYFKRIKECAKSDECIMEAYTHQMYSWGNTIVKNYNVLTWGCWLLIPGLASGVVMLVVSLLLK